MAVNLGNNRLALLTAYQDVIDETTDTDWALYTYEDESNDLTLAASGGGLAEITLTFDSGRVMYGFCGLKEPTAALPRYILINWVGDDVPDARKCACASHVATIADFFQVRPSTGVEVIINASSLEDIDPMAIGQRLTNGTAAVASPVLSRLKTRDEEHGTVYEKTNAEVEMKKINRQEFWEQAKREEEMRKEEEKKKLAEERQRFEEERMELERKEQENREKRYREREQQIEEHSFSLLCVTYESLDSSPQVAEPSIEDLNLDKKESEVEEAKAIIAQRSGNPREFFKQKERAMTISVDTSPVSIHRTDNDDEVSTERNMATVSPIPKIVTTPIKDDYSRDEKEDHQKPPVQESTPTKPVQSVAPQARDSSAVSACESGTDSLVDLWGGSSAPPANVAQPAQSSQSSNLVDLMGDVLHDNLPPSTAAASGRPQPLLSFDDMMDGTFCSGTGAEDDPSSLVDVTGSDQMTLSYQHALQHASGEGQELDDGQLLMTNGEALLKEGTQASEGYFSQSQEEEFGTTEESSAKPAPVFYNKPPEIDITCWDTDPVVDDEDD
uniref:Drebrin n=1 Tax=Maylandia zebra TaxID=106582 RepID=A0A3P9C268_9CICH